MSNVAVVGDSTTVLAFRPLGVDVYAFDVPEDIFEEWPGILARDYAIIIMTEPIFVAAESLVKPLERATAPAVLPVPSVSGTTGLGQERMRKLVEMVVGSVGSREDRLG